MARYAYNYKKKKGERRAKEEEEDNKAKVGKWAGEVKR